MGFEPEFLAAYKCRWAVAGTDQLFVPC
jgi:hypothetical protein